MLYRHNLNPLKMQHMTNSVSGMCNFNVKHTDNQDMKSSGVFFVSIKMAGHYIHKSINCMQV